MSMHTILMGAKTLYFVDYNELTWFISAPFWMDVGEEKKILFGSLSPIKHIQWGIPLIQNKVVDFSFSVHPQWSLHYYYQNFDLGNNPPSHIKTMFFNMFVKLFLYMLSMASMSPFAH